MRKRRTALILAIAIAIVVGLVLVLYPRQTVVRDEDLRDDAGRARTGPGG